MKKNTWLVILAIVVIVIAATAIYFNSEQKTTTFGAMSQEEAREVAMSFVNEIILQGHLSATFIDISEEYGLYKINISIEGQEHNSYITKDGKLFFPEGMNIKEERALVPTR